MSKATITITGNVGKDPLVKFTKTGKTFVSFGVAVTERVKEGDEWVDGPTTWFNVTAWDRAAEAIADNVQRGSKVIVTGRFKMEEWTDQDGVLRTSPSVTADTVGVVPKNTYTGDRERLPQKQARQVEEAPF